ncbi:MAG: hypothetical protein ABJB05_17130 [Parafilimonas sp.]
MKIKIAFAITCIFLIFSFTVNAQLKGIDENGKSVLLFSNGTWRYDVDSLSSNTPATDSISINHSVFSKPSTANFLIKSNVLNVGVYFNTTKWSVKPHGANESEPEYRFELKNNDGYALLLTERTQIDIAEMRDIALLNAQKAAPDAKIVNSEYRQVNGLKMLCLEITGSTRSIKFKYFGYYYSNENGTVQLVTFSSQNLFNELKSDLQDILNGLIEVKK